MEIKPCPFCGGASTVKTGEHEFYDAYVGCDDCGASGGLVNDSCGEDDAETERLNIGVAIEQWNTRVSE